MGRGASRESDSQLTFSQLRVRVRRSELTFLINTLCVDSSDPVASFSPQPRRYAQCGT